MLDKCTNLYAGYVDPILDKCFSFENLMLLSESSALNQLKMEERLNLTRIHCPRIHSDFFVNICVYINYFQDIHICMCIDFHKYIYLYIYGHIHISLH